MHQAKFDRLIETAEKAKHFSDAYIESMMWANRDQETSLEYIRLAIDRVRGRPTKQYPLPERMYSLTNTLEFMTAENELKKAAARLIDLQIEFEQRYKLTTKQSNEVLTEMCKGLKDELFTGARLREKY